jgi:hypothetical protein
MTYTVAWTPTAKSRLCQIWIDSQDRSPITAAADEFDAMLRVRPSDVGESREGETRILTVSPLSIYYQVRDADRCVDVWSVWVSE